MTVRCPSGHESETPDYCDQCGAPIAGAGATPRPAGIPSTAGTPAGIPNTPGSSGTAGTPGTAAGIPSTPGTPAGATQILPVLEEVDTTPATRREPCPACGAPRSGDDRYCEGCGHDFLAPPPAVTGWEAVVTADRAQFDRLAVAGLTFPADYPQRRFPLAEGENRIGRSRGHPGEDPPEIDLATPPIDPGISRLHAVLERRGDGICVLRDLGSTNGTAVGDEPASIAPHTDVPVADGDRIRLGVWTTITLHRR